MSRAATDSFCNEQKWVKLPLWYIFLFPCAWRYLGQLEQRRHWCVLFSTSCSRAFPRRPKLMRRVLGGKGLGNSSGRNPEREERERTPKASYSSGLTFQNFGEHTHQSLFSMGGLWSKKAYAADKKEASRSSLNEGEKSWILQCCSAPDRGFQSLREVCWIFERVKPQPEAWSVWSMVSRVLKSCFLTI